jgi:hypothetical protein
MRNILLLLIVVGLCFAGLSIPNWTSSQESYKPGATGVITLEVANPCPTSGSSSTLGLQAASCEGVDTVNSVSLDYFNPPQVTVSGQKFIGDIEPGGSTKISLPLKVAANARSAIYTVEIQLTGFSERTGDDGGFESFSRRLSLPVTVVDTPIFGLSTDKEFIGGLDTLPIIISNNGGPATNIRIRVGEGSDVVFYGVDEIFLENLGDMAIVDAKFDCRDAEDGPASVPLTLVYEDELGIEHSEATKLRVTVRNERLDISFLQQNNIITRSESMLTMLVRNDGEEAIKDVRLSFADSAVRLKDHNEFKFGDIEPGQAAMASVLVFADLGPGVNLVDSTVTWIERDVQREEERKVPITITSDADVGVYLEAKPLPLTMGSEHTISVLVSNLGSYPIENVDVSLSSPAMRSLDISDRQYIGGLQKDDFSTVQMLMGVNATSEGSYPVYITVNYRDQSGDWKQKTLTQDIAVYSVTEQEQNLIPLIIGVVVLGALVWYFRFRKRSK